MRSIGIIPRLMCYSIAVVSSKISALETVSTITTDSCTFRITSSLVIDWLNAFQSTVICLVNLFFFSFPRLRDVSKWLLDRPWTSVNAAGGEFRTIEARTGVLSGAVDRYLADNDTAKARRINWLNELIEVVWWKSPWIFSLSFSSVFDQFFFFLCLESM